MFKSKEGIKEFLQTADLLISDLDGTLAPAITLRFVIQNFFQRDFMNPSFYFWVLSSVYGYIKQGKDAYPEAWENYLKKLKINPECRIRLKPILYSKVKEFHQLLNEQNPNLKKIIISRTSQDIANPYKDLLEYDEVYGRVKDKGGLVSKILDGYKKCVIIGDSISDKPMLDEAKRQGKESLGIFRYTFKRDKKEGFDLYFKKWKELEGILK